MDSFMGSFNFDLSNSMYSPLGIKSDSTFYNTFSFFFLIGLIMISHLLIFLILLFSKRMSESKWVKLWSILNWVLNKSNSILTFGYYIRTILEINQYMLIWSIKEIFSFNCSESFRIISLIFAFVVLIVCIFLIFATFGLFFSSYETNEDEHCKLGEFYNGIQMCKKNKIYICMLLWRRALFVILLITLNSVSSPITIGVLWFIQLCYLIYIWIIRPFKETKSNMTEIINELYFLFVLFGLIFLNSKNDWKTIFQNIYIWLIWSNTLSVFLIFKGKI